MFRCILFSRSKLRLDGFKWLPFPSSTNVWCFYFIATYSGGVHFIEMISPLALIAVNRYRNITRLLIKILGSEKVVDARQSLVFWIFRTDIFGCNFRDRDDFCKNVTRYIVLMTSALLKQKLHDLRNSALANCQFKVRVACLWWQQRIEGLLWVVQGAKTCNNDFHENNHEHLTQLTLSRIFLLSPKMPLYSVNLAF